MPFRLCLMLEMVLLNGSVFAAENLVLGDWSGILQLGYEGSRQDTEGGELLNSRFDTDLFRESIEIRNRGSYIFDPRLGTANLGLTYERIQEEDHFTDTQGNQDGDLVGYDFDAVILPEKPLNLLLLANQNQSVVNRDFGTRTEVNSQSYGAHFNLREDSLLYDWGVPYFSANLSLDRQQTRETSRGLNQLFRRNEDRKSLDFTANKGYETADLEFRYTYEDTTDTIRSQGAFRNHKLGLNYSQDFGADLNRRWDSRMSYLHRKGADSNDYLIANESLRLDHSEDFYSDYRYLLNRFDTSNGRNQNQLVSAGVHRDFYDQLFTNFILQIQRDDIPNGEQHAYNTNGNFSYRRNLPLEGVLRVNGTAGAQLNDNDLKSRFVEVVDESHTAPDVFGGGQGFFLNRDFVVAASIRVVDVRGGSRLPAELGVDYEVFQEGDRTQILPIATSVLLQPGDPLEVSYRFEVNPAIRFATGFWSIGGSIDYGWIAFSTSRDKSDQKLLAGTDNGLLNDRLTDDAELTFRGNWGAIRGTTSFGFTREDSTRLKFSRWRFRQFLSLIRVLGTRLNFTASEAITNFRLPTDRRRENYTARLTLNGRLLRSLQIDAFAGARRLVDSQIPNEKIREAGINLHHRYGRLSTSAGISWNRFERGLVTTEDWRFQIHLARRL